MADSPHVFTVTEITHTIKGLLEQSLPNVVVEGEISNFRPSGAGHLYFTLKDDDAMISVVMFRGRAQSLTFEPQDGGLVRVTGSVSVYAKRGAYQIIADALEPAGTGRILALLEERKQRLAAEGLFSPERKSPLPLLPECVAVVTSPTGAAIRDIITVVNRRNAGLRVVVFPTAVQGDDAAQQIADQISRADRMKIADVIVVARGGGSIEDLLPFSEEVVVRAVAESSTPVISAVGHEIDFALSDFAADLRAATPSAAAEIVTANRDEIKRRIHDLGRSVIHSYAGILGRARMIQAQFTPQNLERTYRAIVQPYLQRLDDATEGITDGMRRVVTTARHRVSLAGARLEACSPYEILKRGYAVVYNDKGLVVNRSRELRKDENVTMRFVDGTAGALIQDVQNDEKL